MISVFFKKKLIYVLFCLCRSKIRKTKYFSMKCGSLDMVEGVCKKQKDMEILKNSCSSSSCGNRISRTQNLN